MENHPQFRKMMDLGKNSEKKTLFQNIEEHTLSLRKKKNIRQRVYELPPELLSDFEYKVNIQEIEQKVSNDKLLIEYKNCKNEKEALCILFQMLVSENDDLKKYGLLQIREFLVNIDEKVFYDKKYIDEFNYNFICFLFDYLLKKKNDYFFIFNIAYLLNKLFICFHKDEKNAFLEKFINNFNELLSVAKDISNNEPKIKNAVYILCDKIFSCSEDIILNLEKKYPNFIIQIHSELNSLDEKKFVKNMSLISTLLHIINNCFFYEIYGNYFFTTKTHMNSDEIMAENIMSFIQKLLSYSYQMEIFQEELRCIQNFLYFFMEKEEYFNNKTLKNKVKNIIYKFELEKNIVPLVYDSSVNEWDLRVLAIQILINATNICSKKFCEKLIENEISQQIIKLENYFLSQTHFTNKLKDLYILLLDLINNLIENESADIIDNLAIENNCISLLFKLQKIPFYAKQIKVIIRIFNILILSNHKYIHALLISEGICDLYKNILENEPSSDDIEIIINNFISMVNYSENFGKEKNGNKDSVNLLVMHLEKIGISEILNHLKSRNDISDASISAINEISSLINHK